MAAVAQGIVWGFLVLLSVLLAVALWVTRATAEVAERNWRSRERTLIDEARAREQALLDKIIAHAGRPPFVIDPSETVTAIGEAISRITQGPPEVVAGQMRATQDIAERYQAAMREAEGSGPNLVPFGDTDPWMDPMAAREAKIEVPYGAAAEEILGNNGHSRVRLDGRPIEFRSGESGEPPTGGWED